MLACVGSRCWIRMKAMPVPGGSTASSLRKASRPPAEAPSPTTGKLSAAGGERRFRDECRLDGGRAAAVFRVPCPFIARQARTSASHKNVFTNRLCAIHLNRVRELTFSFPSVLIVSPSRGIVGNVHYRTDAGSLFMCMFWEGEKRRAPGPTGNIRKKPPLGPADQVS